jgi:protein tyrosine phosphatase (PTP) superfamily phosphohydrolase (DUF442 family)
MKKAIVFLLLWIGWGFTLGTICLLGPLRWIVDLERKKLASEGTEKGTVIGLIILLAAASLFIAWVAYKKINNANAPQFVKKAMIFTPVVGFVFCVYVFMNPQWVNGMSHKDEIINNQFSIGPYPELEQLKKLKDEGYDGVISLLHPAVVPFEPTLIDRERKNTAEVKLEFVSIPMLPWISDNKESIDSLKRFISKPHGKYYLHCYLGRDRAQAVAKIIKQADKAIIEGEANANVVFAATKLERGQIVQLEKDVYISPLPTKEEYLHLVSNFEQVVSLFDTNDKKSKVANKQEEEWLQSYNTNFKSFNVTKATGTEEMGKVVTEVRKLPRPILIHGFFTDSKEIILFRKIYQQSLEK